MAKAKGTPNKPKYCNVELSKLTELLKPNALIPVQLSWAELFFSVKDLDNVRDVINKDIVEDESEDDSKVKVRLSTKVVEFD